MLQLSGKFYGAPNTLLFIDILSFIIALEPLHLFSL